MCNRENCNLSSPNDLIDTSWNVDESQSALPAPSSGQYSSDAAARIITFDDSPVYRSQQINHNQEPEFGPSRFGAQNARYFPPSNPYNNYSFQPADGYDADYNLNWIPKDINLAEFIEQRMPPIIQERMQNIQTVRNPCATNINNKQAAAAAAAPNEYRLIETEEKLQENARGKDNKVQRKRQETLIEWFDRSVEKELKKYQETSRNGVLNIASLPHPTTTATTTTNNNEAILPEWKLSKGVQERLSEASASQKEICFNLRREPDTELADAVAKLAKAEEMCAFAGAVQAAEAAADAAPPELAEEAAVASARHFQTDVATSEIHKSVDDGAMPIEVVGYVGITKPKYPIGRK